MQRTSAPNIAGAHLPQRARGYWKARFSATREGVERFLERERGQLPLWLVVGFGAGIASWFALDRPADWIAVICLGAGLALAGFALEGGRLERAMGWLGLSLAVGCSLVWLRSEWVEAPRLERPLVVSFEADVERVETLASKGDLRLTLASADPALPSRVRVSIKADDAPSGIAPGGKLRLRARLAPPPPMALPGSHDFARDAWFRGLGAVGRSLGDVEVLRPVAPGGLDSLRDRRPAESLSISMGSRGSKPSRSGSASTPGPCDGLCEFGYVGWVRKGRK